MAKHIQAYFRSEDQAEGARTSLLSFETEQVEVGRLDRAIGRENNILVPFIPGNSNAMGSTYAAIGYPGTSGGGQGVIPVVTSNNYVISEDVDREQTVEERDKVDTDPVIDANFFSDDDYDSLKYVLSVKVKDEDYEDIVQKLRSQGAFVAQLD